ncbi:MAG TPA: hypothetical protein VGJ66_19455 [Pyrinomonadaceae bacterium]|jgi:hypothetical protein
MSEQQNPKRIRERLPLTLPVRIRFREADGNEWNEITRLIDVTPFGAGFKLKRPIEKGRLVHMTMPMPRQLRVFDHVEDQYKVWAIVRYVKSAAATGSTTPIFDLGVAFIGKHPPRGYEENPARRYEIDGPTSEHLNTIEEWTPTELTSLDNRVQTRHNIPVDMLVESFNEKGEVELSEQTVTENINEKGAAIYTTLSLPVGRLIRLSSVQYKVTVYAAVRGQSMGPEGVRRLHVEFIDREWPL